MPFQIVGHDDARGNAGTEVIMKFKNPNHIRGAHLRNGVGNGDNAEFVAAEGLSGTLFLEFSGMLVKILGP